MTTKQEPVPVTTTYVIKIDCPDTAGLAQVQDVLGDDVNLGDELYDLGATWLDAWRHDGTCYAENGAVTWWFPGEMPKHFFRDYPTLQFRVSFAAESRAIALRVKAWDTFPGRSPARRLP